MLKEFKEFAVRGNVVDMAVGIIIGGAFGAIANSLVNDIIMPPLGLVLAGTDFSGFYLLLKPGLPPPPYESLAAAQAAGAVTLNYGVFGNAVLSFLVVAGATFFLVRGINRLRRQQESTPAPRPARPAATARPAFPLQRAAVPTAPRSCSFL